MIPRYVALVDGEPGAFGVIIPDCPGCYGMGDTIEAALDNATLGLRDWIGALEADGAQAPVPRDWAAVRAEAKANPAARDAFCAVVPLIPRGRRSVRVTLSLDAGLLSALDATARRLGVTRSGMVEMLATAALPGL